MLHPINLCLLFSLCSWPAMSLAAEIYRMVDESGQVIFTDSPPKDASQVERVDLPPGPSPGSIRAAETRNKAIREQLKQVQKQRSRQTRSRNERIQQAERKLAEAELRLTEAKTLKDEDRQSLAGGKRRIRPEYFEKIKKAEEAVEAAKKNLQKVRSSS